jgi:hypothetical protein
MSESKPASGPPATGAKARKPFLLRVDPELWTELERWAADELRSVNSQVEMLLRQAVQKRKGRAG